MTFREELIQADFATRVQRLMDIDRSGDTSVIPDLVEIMVHPLGDTAVDNILLDVLRNLLGHHPELGLPLLSHEDPRVRRFAIEVVQRYKIHAAVPVLVDQALAERDSDRLLLLLSALISLEGGERLEVFRRFLGHRDPMVAGLAIEGVGLVRDEASSRKLMMIIDQAERGERYHTCTIPVAKAVEALSLIGGEKEREYLLAKLHHRNPTTRRLVHEEILSHGALMLDGLGRILEEGSTDDQIMACNILGALRERKGGEALVAALDGGRLAEPNVLYALYEALGNIPFMKGLVVLLDGLKQPEPMLLMSVVTSLEQQCSSPVLERLQDVLGGELMPAARIMQAIVYSRSVRIFEGVFPHLDHSRQEMMLQQIADSNDREVLMAFAQVLRRLGEEEKAGSLDAQIEIRDVRTGFHLLAADDSRAMQFFYRSLGADLGFHVAVVGNGQHALEYLESGESVDLLITDMNMPVMDGVELTEKIRQHLLFSSLPILMATTESEASQVELARKAGVGEFITKPFGVDHLMTVISRMRNG